MGDSDARRGAPRKPGSDRAPYPILIEYTEMIYVHQRHLRVYKLCPLLSLHPSHLIIITGQHWLQDSHSVDILYNITANLYNTISTFTSTSTIQRIQHPHIHIITHTSHITMSKNFSDTASEVTLTDVASTYSKTTGKSPVHCHIYSPHLTCPGRHKEAQPAWPSAECRLHIALECQDTLTQHIGYTQRPQQELGGSVLCHPVMPPWVHLCLRHGGDGVSC